MDEYMYLFGNINLTVLSDKSSLKDIHTDDKIFSF